MAFNYKYLALICCVGLSSCFKEELPNSECDIEKVFIQVDSPNEFFFNSSDSVIDVNSIDSIVFLKVKPKADVTALAPKFQLTKGATIVPENGSVQDFSKGVVKYTVTSEDRLWHRNYFLNFIPTGKVYGDTLYFDFEHYKLEDVEKRYYVWHHILPNGTFDFTWASANPGFRITADKAKPDEYPTAPYENGYDGACVRLTTRSTGELGQMVKKPLAAGNFFIGTFDVSSAMLDAMKATRFGMPFEKIPKQLTGYYRYKPGEVFKDIDGNVIPDRKDKPAIYAVFYKNHDAAGKPIVLYGDNVKTSENIVAIAMAKTLKPTSFWTEFKVDFDFKQVVDPKVLEDKGYSITVVFSSSSEGDLFNGAIGSDLMVDKVRLICEEDK